MKIHDLAIFGVGSRSKAAETLEEFSVEKNITGTVSYTHLVYMGGVKGLLHINSNLPPATSELPKLQLSDVIVNRESVNNELCGDPTGISVPWNSNIKIGRAHV